MWVVLLIKHEAKVSAVSCENQMYIQSAILVTHEIHLSTITMHYYDYQMYIVCL